MTSEIGKTLNDDEYQFPHEEYGSEIHAMKEKLVEENKQPIGGGFKEQIPGLIEKLSFGKHKRIYITIGIIGFAFIFFKIMKPSHQTIQTAPVAVASQPALPRVEANAEIVGQLNSLKQQQYDSQTAMNTMQTQVQNLRQELNQNSTSQAQLNQTVSILVDEIKKLSEDMKHTEAHKTIKSDTPEVVYNLKAIVPGRAWIETTEGQSDTVSVGDTVENYGTVTAIDADQGVVSMNTGKMIRYGERDS